MRSILTLATLFALVVLPGVAAAQTVTLVVDKPIVGVGGMATVEVVVEGGTGIAGTPTLLLQRLRPRVCGPVEPVSDGPRQRLPVGDLSVPTAGEDGG